MEMSNKCAAANKQEDRVNWAFAKGFWVLWEKHGVHQLREAIQEIANLLKLLKDNGGLAVSIRRNTFIKGPPEIHCTEAAQENKELCQEGLPAPG